MKDHPIFICGHPKSGTSLLRNLLDHHPQLIVYPEETLFFRNFLPKVADLSLEQMIELGEQELIHIFEWNLDHPPAHQDGFPDRDYSFISYEEVRHRFGEQIRAEGIRHPGDVLWAAVKSFSTVTGEGQQDQTGWVEETPYNEYFADKIFSWWPQARCIHIVRDPRDNYASYKRKHESWSPGFFALNWNRSASAGFQNLARYGNDHYWILRYEDLVGEPERILEKVRQFVGIEDHPNLLRPTRAGELWQGNSMFEDKFEHISDVSVGRWREKLAYREAGVIQVMTRRFRRRLSYPDAVPETIVDRITGWGWRMRELISKIRRV